MQHLIRGISSSTSFAVPQTQRFTATVGRRSTGLVYPFFSSSAKGPTGPDAPHVVTRGPVSWAGLGLAAVLAATAVGYYKIERERRLENAMGKIVSSESGWSPNPELFAPRKYLVCFYTLQT